MSLKETIVQWSEGVDMALEGRSEEAIGVWTSMQEPSARIYFNIACMHLLLGSLDNAERNLDLAVQKDPHFALAYFQRGYLRLQRQSYHEALNDLDTALKNLRGNLLIDYKQLGLQYKLYSCEVMYNHAYGLHCNGRAAEAREELERAKTIAAGTTESRHKIILAALGSIKFGTAFQPYRLPEKAMVFQPPRNKREVLKPINFLGKAKVLSSVVDQDSYVGFVGVQEEKQQRARSSSPRAPQARSPPTLQAGYPSPRSPLSPNRSPSPRGPPTSQDVSAKQPRPALPASVRLPKPNIPPPSPEMKIRSRSSSLTGKEKVNVSHRPPKPSTVPPPLHSDLSNTRSGVGHSKSEDGEKPKKPGLAKLKSNGMMTVKVHYSVTRALRVSTSITYQQLQNLICKKFDQPEDSLTLWCKKKNGEVNEIKSEQSLREVAASLDDGFRITLWAYDKFEEPVEEEAVLLECVATHTYQGQYEDEMSFKAGDRVQVTADINDDWYQGRCGGVAGIFPKSYVKAL